MRKNTLPHTHTSHPLHLRASGDADARAGDGAGRGARGCVRACAIGIRHSGCSRARRKLWCRNARADVAGCSVNVTRAVGGCAGATASQPSPAWRGSIIQSGVQNGRSAAAGAETRPAVMRAGDGRCHWLLKTDEDIVGRFRRGARTRVCPRGRLSCQSVEISTALSFLPNRNKPGRKRNALFAQLSHPDSTPRSTVQCCRCISHARVVSPRVPFAPPPTADFYASMACTAPHLICHTEIPV